MTSEGSHDLTSATAMMRVGVVQASPVSIVCVCIVSYAHLEYIVSYAHLEYIVSYAHLCPLTSLSCFSPGEEICFF